MTASGTSSGARRCLRTPRASQTAQEPRPLSNRNQTPSAARVQAGVMRSASSRNRADRHRAVPGGRRRADSEALPRIVWLRWVKDDTRAEQIEACAAVHLAFDHFDLVDGSLDLAGAVGQGEAVDDGLLVVADSGGEGAQVRLAVVCFHGGEPGFQVAVSGAVSHHLGEAGHVPGEGVDVRAAGAYGAELGLFFGLEMVGVGEQPAGDLPVFG